MCIRDRDTSIEYMTKLKSVVPKVINFEDTGKGVKLSDLTINALYLNGALSDGKIFSGPSFLCLQDNLGSLKKTTVSRKVNKIFICFGATDPNNLILEYLEVLKSLLPLDITVNLVVGAGYEKIEDLSKSCLLYTSPSPRDRTRSRMPSSA